MTKSNLWHRSGNWCTSGKEQLFAETLLCACLLNKTSRHREGELFLILVLNGVAQKQVSAQEKRQRRSSNTWRSPFDPKARPAS